MSGSQQKKDTHISSEIAEYRDLLVFLKENEDKLRKLLSSNMVSFHDIEEFLDVRTEKEKCLTIRIDENTLQRLEETSSFLKTSKNRFINAAILSMLQYYENHRKESEEMTQFDSLVEQSMEREYTLEEESIKEYIGQDEFINTLKNWKNMDLK